MAAEDSDGEYEPLGLNLDGLKDHPIAAVSLSADKEILSLKFDGGPEIRFGVEGDCCSSSWIEHIDVPPDVIGERIIAVTESSFVADAGGEYECLQVYSTRFRTAKGDIVVEYRNESNGYYGGNLYRMAEDGPKQY